MRNLERQLEAARALAATGAELHAEVVRRQAAVDEGLRTGEPGMPESTPP